MLPFAEKARQIESHKSQFESSSKEWCDRFEAARDELEKCTENTYKLENAINKAKGDFEVR